MQLIGANGKTVDAIRKASAIRKDLTPDGPRYSFPSIPEKSTEYNGMWKCDWIGDKIVVGNKYLHNYVFCSSNLVYDIYGTIEVPLPSPMDKYTKTLFDVVLGITKDKIEFHIVGTFWELNNHTDGQQEYVLLATYRYGIFYQVQFGAIRLNRFWMRGNVT